MVIRTCRTEDLNLEDAVVGGPRRHVDDRDGERRPRGSTCCYRLGSDTDPRCPQEHAEIEPEPVTAQE